MYDRKYTYLLEALLAHSAQWRRMSAGSRFLKWGWGIKGDQGLWDILFSFFNLGGGGIPSLLLIPLSRLPIKLLNGPILVLT